jgi:hypothetical protein
VVLTVPTSFVLCAQASNAIHMSRVVAASVCCTINQTSWILNPTSSWPVEYVVTMSYSCRSSIADWISSSSVGATQSVCIGNSHLTRQKQSSSRICSKLLMLCHWHPCASESYSFILNLTFSYYNS